MNNAKMWLVVNPTVGVPLFFVGVAVTSLIVHTAVISNGVGAWYTPYIAGEAPVATATLDSAPAMLPAAADAEVELPTLTQAALLQ